MDFFYFYSFTVLLFILMFCNWSFLSSYNIVPFQSIGEIYLWIGETSSIESFSIIFCVSQDFIRWVIFFYFFLLWLDNMTPVPQCQWLGMFCTCSAPINLQQVHQLAQQEGTTVLPAHVTQEKCTNGGFFWLISPQRNTDHTCNDLPKSVLTAVWQ